MVRTAALVALFLVQLPATNAAADRAVCTSTTCSVADGYREPANPRSPRPAGPRSRSASSHEPCRRGGTVEVLASDGDDYHARLAGSSGFPIPHAPPPGDRWVISACFASPGGAFYLDGPPTLAVADVTDARPFQSAALARAIAIVNLHRPELVTSPPLDAHVVAIPAWIATTPATTSVLTESVTDGPVTVAITATPTHLTFNPGDDSPPIVCTPAPTTPADGCGHTYPVNGTFGTTARLHYTVDWTSTIGGFGTIADGAVTTTPTDLTVREIQSLIR